MAKKSKKEKEKKMYLEKQHASNVRKNKRHGPKQKPVVEEKKPKIKISPLSALQFFLKKKVYTNRCAKSNHPIIHQSNTEDACDGILYLCVTNMVNNARQSNCLFPQRYQTKDEKRRAICGLLLN